MKILLIPGDSLRLILWLLTCKILLARKKIICKSYAN